jgi:hypothetical protein
MTSLIKSIVEKLFFQEELAIKEIVKNYSLNSWINVSLYSQEKVKAF